MECFQGKLLDGERILFGKISGQFEPGDHQGPRVGHFEVRELGPPILATNRPYRLALDDGRTEAIYLTGLRPGNTTRAPILAFRISKAMLPTSG